MKDIIVTAITVVLAAALIFLVNSESEKTKELRQTSNLLEIKTNELTLRKKELKNELETLQSSFEEKEKGTTSVMLVFNEIDSKFLGEIVPELNKNDIPGTLCITKDNIPDISELLSLFDLTVLLQSGWQTAMYWDGTEELDLWYFDLTRLMSEVGVEIPKVICLDRSLYDQTLDDKIIALGFEHIMIRSTSSEEFVVNTKENLNIINGFSWYTTQSASKLSSLDVEKSQLAIFVGVNGNGLAYERSQFNAMILTATNKRDSGALILTTPDGALRQVAQNAAEYEKYLSEHNGRVDALKEEIAKTEDELANVYDLYTRKYEQ